MKKFEKIESFRKGFKDFLNTATIYAKVFHLSWHVSPFDFIIYGLMTVLQSLLPAVTVYITKLIVDNASNANHPLKIGELVLLWGISIFLGRALVPWQTFVSGNLSERLGNEVLLRIIRKVNSFPDLEVFENPAFYDDLQIIYNECGFRPINFIFQGFGFVQCIFSSLSFLLMLAILQWWIPILVLVSSLPSVFVLQKLERDGFWWEQKSNEERRMMMYIRRVATTHEFAKEVRVYGLGDYFETRYTNAFNSMHQSMRSLRARKAFVPLFSTIVALVGNVFAFYWIVAGVSRGEVSVGSAVLYVQGLAQLQAWVDRTISVVSWFSGTIEFFKKYFLMLNTQPKMIVAIDGKPVPLDLTIKFENVSFNYPDGRKALENVTFTITPGLRIAIVGENGAGKTTIVKLISRLYDPTIGKITIGGIDLREINLYAWRQCIGAVFQDFVQYELSTRENIAIGDLKKLKNDNALEEAAKKAGFNLEQIGLDVMLGQQFEGTELSGGQWQKLATARAFLRDAKILILDEPSAALDPFAEAALFSQFISLSLGKTTFLITHRLASTSKADLILVFKDGKLIESGSHLDLMIKGTDYATMYTVQSSQYDVQIAR